MSDNEYDIDDRPLKRARSSYNDQDEDRNIDPSLLNWGNNNATNQTQDASLQGFGQWAQEGGVVQGTGQFHNYMNETTPVGMNASGMQYSNDVNEAIHDFNAAFPHGQDDTPQHHQQPSRISFDFTSPAQPDYMFETPPASAVQETSGSQQFGGHDATMPPPTDPRLAINTSPYHYTMPQAGPAGQYLTPSSTTSAYPPFSYETTDQDHTPTRPALQLPPERQGLDQILRGTTESSINVQRWTQDNPNRTNNQPSQQQQQQFLNTPNPTPTRSRRRAGSRASSAASHTNNQRSQEQYLNTPTSTGSRRRAGSPASSAASHTCSTCSRRCKSKADRDHHQRIHEEKTHVCSFGCGHEAFQFRKDLLRHEKRHTGEREFKCDVDGCEYRTKGFPRNDQLKRHLESVHGRIFKKEQR